MDKLFGANLAEAMQGIETSFGQAHEGGNAVAAHMLEGFGGASITRDMSNDIAAPRPSNGFDIA